MKMQCRILTFNLQSLDSRTVSLLGIRGESLNNDSAYDVYDLRSECEDEDEDVLFPQTGKRIEASCRTWLLLLFYPFHSSHTNPKIRRL